MKSMAVIPARYASTRFPGKPLALIGGKPMLAHVYENSLTTGIFSEVIIATDDKRIFSFCRENNFNVLMTSDILNNGTERVAEAIKISGSDADVIFNIQGDEPFISAEPLHALLNIFGNEKAEIGTLYKRNENISEIENPNTVKLTTDKNGRVLYFSRSVIPYCKEKTGRFTHIGIYAFRKKTLGEIVTLPLSALEKNESLEQLRWLENGYNIYAAETNYQMISVDTPEDLQRAEEHFIIHNKTINHTL